MATRRPLVVVNGVTSELPSGDTTPTNSVAPGTARQLLQTNAGGTATEWTSNVDVPGTLDVTSTATFDSIAQYPAGSAGAPTITFTGDTNTGIYSPGADQVAISTGGSGRLFVDASGNVGVGTSTITGKLSLGASQDFVFGNQSSTGTGGTGRLVATGGEVYIQAGLAATAGSNAPIIFTGYGGVGERLRITSAGLVGVGTSSVSSLLHLASSGPVLTLQRSDSASPGAAINFTNNTSGVNWQIGTNQAVGGSAFEINSGNQANNRFVITSGGLVGIGTSSPSESIHTTGKLRVGDGGNYTVAAVQLGSSNANGISYPGTNILNFITNSTAALTIDASQRVGIGTSSPVNIGAGYNGLTVNGSTAGTIYLQGGGTSGGRLLATSTDFYIGTVQAGGNLIFQHQDGSYERARIDSSGRLLVGTSSASGVNSNTAPVLAGNFASFTGSVSANHNTATTLFTLENLNATYMVTAVITGTANAGAYHAVYIVGSIVTDSHSIQALKAGSLLTLSLSGANVQATQGSGVAQTVTWSVTRMANF